jgi:hypothetical protein
MDEPADPWPPTSDLVSERPTPMIDEATQDNGQPEHFAVRDQYHHALQTIALLRVLAMACRRFEDKPEIVGASGIEALRRTAESAEAHAVRAYVINMQDNTHHVEGLIRAERAARTAAQRTGRPSSGDAPQAPLNVNESNAPISKGVDLQA